MGESLGGRGHRINNKVVDFPLLLRLHPIVRIVGAVRAVAAGDLASNLTGKVGNIKILDMLRGGLSGEQPFPCGLDAAAKRRNHPQAGDDDTTHRLLSSSCFGNLMPGALQSAQPVSPIWPRQNRVTRRYSSPGT